MQLRVLIHIVCLYDAKQENVQCKCSMQKKNKVGLHEVKKYYGHSACSNKSKMEMRVVLG